jgi:glycosyltransferase involved in cell wall biosynthesis
MKTLYKMSKQPLISVIMPVFNAEKYLAEAIRNVVDQTFRDFELLIIDDGSTDTSLEIIKSFKDSRIKCVMNTQNKGNYYSRNRGWQIAKGKYIIVMDSDDVCELNRLEVQFVFMEENPSVGLAGTCIRFLGSKQIIFREPFYEILKITLLRNNFICHPSIILRNSFFKKNQLLYDDTFWYAGDYDLCVKASRFFPVVNMNEPLLNYRISQEQLTASMFKYSHEVTKIRISQLENFGIVPTEEEKQTHLNLVNRNLNDLDKINQWTDKLLTANSNTKYYNQTYLDDFFKVLVNNSIC